MEEQKELNELNQRARANAEYYAQKRKTIADRKAAQKAEWHHKNMVATLQREIVALCVLILVVMLYGVIPAAFIKATSINHH